LHVLAASLFGGAVLFVGILIDGLLYLIVGFSSGVPKSCHLYVFIYNTVNYFVITADYNTSVFGWKV
jgi:hypothetical protein